jgi:hypothetical protein
MNQLLGRDSRRLRDPPGHVVGLPENAGKGYSLVDSALEPVRSPERRPRPIRTTVEPPRLAPCGANRCWSDRGEASSGFRLGSRHLVRNRIAGPTWRERRFSFTIRLAVGPAPTHLRHRLHFAAQAVNRHCAQHGGTPRLLNACRPVMTNPGEDLSPVVLRVFLPASLCRASTAGV